MSLIITCLRGTRLDTTAYLGIPTYWAYRGITMAQMIEFYFPDPAVAYWAFRGLAGGGAELGIEKIAAL
jgi:hypothetical protein